MKLVRTPSLFHSRNSLLNPLSLMNPSRLFRNFVFLFSLLGLGSVAWGERYETVFVTTEDTPTMTQAEALAYVNSPSCKSAQSLTVSRGEIATIVASNAVVRPNTVLNTANDAYGTFVYGIEIDIVGMDSNTTIESWNINNSDSTISNIAVGTIVGPAEVKVKIKPKSGRGNGSQYWYTNDIDTWDFQGSEGYVTFRIDGSEQAPSKKFATVIPENASTNIRVVLEQSTDLINWTTASPGVFPPSTAKRFFRVRSEEE
jgi:hypothetical protein